MNKIISRFTLKDLEEIFIKKNLIELKRRYFRWYMNLIESLERSKELSALKLNGKGRNC